MLLTVPNAALEALLASPALLERAFPGMHQEAMMLIHLLRVSTPSLADALTWGLLSVLTPASPRPTAAIAVARRRAVLSATAFGEDGDRVIAPYDRPGEVTHLEVADLAVAGRSCLGMTG